MPCPTCYDSVTERGWKSNSTVRLSSMQNRQTIFIWAVCLWTVTLPGLSGQTTQVEGSVRDPSGAVIANASVVLNSGSYQAAVNTGADGHFLFLTVPSISGTVDISREGFNPVRQRWNLGSATSVSLEIVLHPGAASEQVTVSAARTEVRLSETPGSTILLSGKDVAATPALTKRPSNCRFDSICSKGASPVRCSCLDARTIVRVNCSIPRCPGGR